MPGASNLAIFIDIFWHAFSVSGILKATAHNFMKSRLGVGLAAKGLLQMILFITPLVNERFRNIP